MPKSVKTIIDKMSKDTVYRQDAIDALEQIFDRCEEIEVHLPEGDPDRTGYKMYPDYLTVWKYLHQLPSAQPEPEKYEYHYDHTDCIWYRPEARNRCPTTCAQYRDGWNDAMNYIFRDGKGYRPYRRDKQYGE